MAWISALSRVRTELDEQPARARTIELTEVDALPRPQYQTTLLDQHGLPAANQTGFNDVTVKIEDTGALTDTDVVRITVDAVNDGQNLLAFIGFDGTGNYLKGKSAALKGDANALASTLDLYNNGGLCN